MTDLDYTQTELIGKWGIESSDNFEAFLTKLGVNYFLKKAALFVKAPNILIAYDGDGKWSFRIRSTFKNTDTEFKLNEEFEETTVDGRHIKSIFWFEGLNKLVNEQRDFKTGELQCIGVREISQDGKLIEILTAGEVVARRVWFKIQS